ncbi:type IV toxin-antitoxin system YeeU family antitoxin [Yersinia intermedia]|uniref:type IV toxin-antitoxin system YeeU family antitoxin n=1 Tax=Yersinia intermedia TaxID=631 RepID=UPI001CFCEC4B|nr:type IV toxin-antitoxin system YeeU family antitoxin [Yersinia intermedia]MCB5299230.1 type IV toxin-antitoxin system YeeU family antitoxin [Yersinia intermedia]
MDNHITTSPTLGLKRDITPRLGARLVQEGTHLHFLSDRANVVGTFAPDTLQALEVAFSALLTELEARLCSGELDPRRQRCITVQHAGFTCEADTLGSFGHLYIAVYQTTPPYRALKP